MFFDKSLTYPTKAICFCMIFFSLFLLTACGGGGGGQAQVQIEFAVKHLSDRTGEQITELVSYEEEFGLDNTSGDAPLQVQIEFQRNYKHQIIDRIETNDLSSKRVIDKIVELYKLPPNDPEGVIQTALCPVSIVIPAGQKAKITVEWTERWADGVINRGRDGEGDRLGTFQVFLGYIEPCSLVDQVNIADE